MSQPDYPFQLLDESKFKEYTSNWQSALTSGKPLTQYFDCGAQVSQRWLNYVYFKVADILYLLSSVGTYYINLQFAVVPAPLASGPMFSVILYGSNQNKEITSAYFCAAIPGQGAPVDTKNGNNNPAILETSNAAKNPLAYPLASVWINNWDGLITEEYSMLSSTPVITPVAIDASIFESISGPLQGYRYPLKDLLLAISPLLAASDQSTQLRFVFGMHHYLKPESIGLSEQSRLFGMIIHVNKTDNPIQLSNDSAYYDISEPCPPYCH